MFKAFEYRHIGMMLQISKRVLNVNNVNSAVDHAKKFKFRSDIYKQNVLVLLRLSDSVK